MSDGATVYWIHGGCFTGGSVAWDSIPRQTVAETAKCRVVAIDFDTSSLDAALSSIHDIVLADREEHKAQDGPVVFVGVSSGAYLAHVTACQFDAGAVLLGPVLDPRARHGRLPAADQQKQLAFFGSLEDMEPAEHDGPGLRVLVVGRHDKRACVPEDGFRYDQMIVPDTDHKGCCKDPPSAFYKAVTHLVRHPGRPFRIVSIVDAEVVDSNPFQKNAVGPP